MSERTTGDTVGGGGIGAVIGFGVGGPLGALIGGAIGGLIGGKNIAKGAVGILENGFKQASGNRRYSSEQREKAKEAAETLKSMRDSIR